MKDLHYYALITVCLMIGVLLATQTAVNTQLKTAFTSPIHAALISFVVGTCVLTMVACTLPRPWTTMSLGILPWWAWVGGLLGAFNISMTVFLAPRLGALTLAACTITSQLIASALFDHFGLLGFAKMDLSLTRILGMLLLCLGMFLVIQK